MNGLVVDADWEPKEDYPVSTAESESRRAVLADQVWRHPRWSVAERPDVEISAPDEVLIKTRACGICGSDVHMYETDADGYMLLPYRLRLPVAIGHEFSGEIVETGPAVRHLKPGDAVAVEAQRYCNSCLPCRKGLFNQCVNGEDQGFTLDGGTAQYVVAPARHCYLLNDLREQYGEERAYDIGAVTEPTSVSYHAMFVRAGGFEPGEHVAVFGCGPIGLAAVGLARAAGAGKVIAVDTQPERRELALALGADEALDPLAEGPGTDLGREIDRITSGVGAGMVVEASGAGAAVMPHVEQAVAVGGKVTIVGVDGGVVPVRTVLFQVKAAQVYGALGHLCGGFERSISLHAAGRLDMSAMVTSRFPLAEGVAALERAGQRHDAKILIYPNLNTRP